MNDEFAPTWMCAPTTAAAPNGDSAGPSAIEPHLAGLYWDRDGDIWQRENAGWRLILQSGVSVDPISVWGWESGHVRDYAPFTPVSSFATADG
ncbi:MAG: hypothetical protein JWN03_7361 [Nocardia sp.]|uniref:hypothetical protein n=1 Tax=Nocardia sp. TaxID=1821 RepID=UPI0026109AE5|nr:hypothetical protein [Nocardia sp.]MCU1647086.1 hypothetical protein [Nocardia sp.]